MFQPYLKRKVFTKISREIENTRRIRKAEERLFKRENMMWDIRGLNAVEAWIFGVIETVSGLTQALEWNELTNTPGGKKQKGRYVARMFEDKKREDEAKNPDGQTESNLKKSAFSRMYGKIVTSRNHTLRLYEMVSVFPG